MLRDINEPIKNWFPFIFHNWVFQKENSEYFEHYLCFLNIEKISEQGKLFYQDSNDEEEEINFQDYMQAFKIDYYQGKNESLLLKGIKNDQVCYRKYVESLGQNSQSLFARSSSWQQNIYSHKYYDDLQQYSARYTFAVNVKFEEINTIEFKDILVTIDLDKNIDINQDQKAFCKNYKIKD